MSLTPASLTQLLGPQGNQAAFDVSYGAGTEQAVLTRLGEQIARIQQLAGGRTVLTQLDASQDLAKLRSEALTGLRHVNPQMAAIFEDPATPLPHILATLEASMQARAAANRPGATATPGQVTAAGPGPAGGQPPTEDRREDEPAPQRVARRQVGPTRLRINPPRSGTELVSAMPRRVRRPGEVEVV